MLIAFIHPGKAFLPELEMYQNFFRERGIDSVIMEANGIEPAKVDVEWHFMGKNFRRRFKNSLLIHEYASTSVPPFAQLKNRLKKHINARPDYRIFQNPAIANAFGFTDNVPFGYRDMGVDLTVFSPKQCARDFDFIFCGTITTDMKFEKLLDIFSVGQFKEKSLLVVSKNYDYLKKQYSSHLNITFHGPVDQAKVAELINKSRFAINYKPLGPPYDLQTATKVLEYLACKVPVVTTPTTWIKQFSDTHDSKMFYLPEDLNAVTTFDVEKFDYSFPDLSVFSWDKQILGSGILEFIKMRQTSHAGIVPRISS